MAGTDRCAPWERGCEDPLLERYRRSSATSGPKTSRNSCGGGERRQLTSERLRVFVRRAPNPRSVLGSYEPRKRDAVVERSNGSETSAADDCDAPSLRLDATPRLAVIRRRDEMLVAKTNLGRQSALPRLGQQLVRLEASVDLGGETESLQPAGGEDDSVEPPLASLAEPRVDVPAQRLDRELGLEREQLRPSSDRGCTNAQSRSQLRDAAEGVARVLALEIGADNEAVGIRRRHVLRRMHRDVDPSGEQRFLELLHEDAARADLAARPSQLLGGDTRLREGEPTAAGPDTNEHDTSTSGALSARTSSAAAEHARTRSEPEAGAACR